MGIYRQFPYSNFHDMNLDWLLERLREYMDITHALEQNITDFEGRVELDINEFKTYINNRVDGFIEYIENYLEDLAVPQAVQEILDRWLAEGIFDEVLNRLVEDAMQVVEEKMEEYKQEQANKLSSNDIDIEPKFTYVYKDNRTDSPSFPQYPVFQSICVADDGNIITIGHDESENTDSAKIRVFSSDGNLIREGIVSTGHSNGMTYRNGKLYVAFMKTINESESDKLAIINYSTLQVEEVKNMGVYFRAITWNNDNNTFILAGANGYFYVYDSNLDQRVETFSLPTQNYSNFQSLQDIFYYNNYVGVVVSYPNVIAFYDLTTKELVKLYNPKQRTGRYSAPFNEIESVAIFNKKFYITAFARLDNHKSMNIIAVMDPWLNVLTDYTKRNRYSGTLTIYVDGSYNGIIQNGEYDVSKGVNTPFNHIMQAISMVQSEVSTTSPVTIACRRGTDVGALVAHTLTNVAIIPYGDGADPFILNGVRLNRCSNFLIREGKIKYNSLASTGSANAYFVYSNGALEKCVIDGDTVAIDNPIAIYAGSESQIRINSITTANTFNVGMQINESSEIIATGTINNPATTRVRTIAQSRYISTIKMKPADSRYRFESLGLVAQPWVHIYSGAFNNINQYENMNNDTAITNINQGVNEICIEASFGSGKKKHTFALTTDNGTSAFNISLYNKFTALWEGIAIGEIDLVNKRFRITEQYSHNTGSGAWYNRSDGTAPSGTAWCGITNIWVR